MINKQDHGTFYAYCICGVCGRPRRSRQDARRDERAHSSVCSARRATT